MWTGKAALMGAPRLPLLWQRSRLPVAFDSVSDNSAALAPSAHSQSCSSGKVLSACLKKVHRHPCCQIGTVPGDQRASIIFIP